MATKIIGVLGGAGSGKSEALRIFKEKYHAHLLIADDIAKELSAPGGISYYKIIEAFGKEILKEDGTIDRSKLADIVFHHKDKLELLNGITHPDVKGEIKKRIAEAVEEKIPYVVLEAALLVECGYRNMCDEFWYVYSSEEVRRKRMKETRNYSDEKIDAIIRNQLSEEEFRKNSDRVINNNSTIEKLEKEIDRNLE